MWVGCGSTPTTSAPPWRSAHPDPAGMTFDEQAPGLCAVGPQFADEAPAAIEYVGETYVQASRSTVPARLPGVVLATSDGWTVRAVQGGRSLLLITPDAVYTYRASGGC
jgi:hypothetical protein